MEMNLSFHWQSVLNQKWLYGITTFTSTKHNLLGYQNDAQADLYINRSYQSKNWRKPQVLLEELIKSA